MCLSKDPKFIKGYYRLASAQIELGQLDQADTTLLAALKVDSGKPITIFLVSRFWLHSTIGPLDLIYGFFTLLIILLSYCHFGFVTENEPILKLRRTVKTKKAAAAAAKKPTRQLDENQVKEVTRKFTSTNCISI